MKTALVTGASKGIGKAIALNLINNGYEVHATYNTGKKEAEEFEQEFETLTFHHCNFLELEQLDELITNLMEVKFDCLINNAGMIEFESFENFDFINWKNTFEVNLHAPLLITLKLKDSLKENSSVVNIASLDGYIGSFASMAYSASKAALINVTKSLGNNFGKLGIRVNAIAPGWINTGMSTEESFEATKLTPLGRNGTPEEVANLVEFLVSDKAAFINGETIIIDGGYANVDYIMLQESLNN